LASGLFAWMPIDAPARHSGPPPCGPQWVQGVMTHGFRLMTSTRSNRWRPRIPGDGVRGVDRVDEWVGPVGDPRTAVALPPFNRGRNASRGIACAEVPRGSAPQGPGPSKRRTVASLGIGSAPQIGPTRSRSVSSGKRARSTRTPALTDHRAEASCQAGLPSCIGILRHLTAYGRKLETASAHPLEIRALCYRLGHLHPEEPPLTICLTRCVLQLAHALRRTSSRRDESGPRIFVPKVLVGVCAGFGRGNCQEERSRSRLVHGSPPRKFSVFS